VGERQGDNNDGRVTDRVTVAEAATLLGVHRNTVYSRVRARMYKAEKVLTERGPTWMIDRDSLTTNATTSAPQQPVSGVPAIQQEALQELARQIVREAGLQAEDQQELAEQRERDERAARYSAFHETMREGWHLQLEIPKYASAASGVLLLGLAAFAALSDPAPTWPGVAAVGAVLLVVTLVVSIIEMTLVPHIVLYQTGKDFLSVSVFDPLIREGIEPDEEQKKAMDEEIEKEMKELPGSGLGRNTTLWTFMRRTTLATLIGGAVCVVIFVLRNLVGGLWP
jgi:hypothetical protein